MPRFDQESAVAAMELHQLIAEWANELDANGGLTMPRLCTEDCVILVGGVTYRGHTAVQKFYSDRGERVRTQQKDGVRTQRHTVTNLRVAFSGHAAGGGEIPARELFQGRERRRAATSWSARPSSPTAAWSSAWKPTASGASPCSTAPRSSSATIPS